MTSATRNGVLLKKWNWIDWIVFCAIVVILEVIYFLAVSKYSTDSPLSLGHLVRAFLIGGLVATGLHRALVRKVLATVFPRHYRVFYCSNCDGVISAEEIKCPGCGAEFINTKYYVETEE